MNSNAIHKLIPTTDELTWHESLQSIPHSVFHTLHYNQALEKSIKKPIYLYTYHSDSAQIICPISIRHYKKTSDIYTPFGYSGFTGIGFDSNFEKNFNAFCFEQGFIAAYIAQHPVLLQHYPIPLEQLHIKNHFQMLNLHKSSKELFAECGKTTRNCLRNWLKKEHHIITDKSSLAPYLPTLYQQTLLRTQANESYHHGQAIFDYLIHSPTASLLAIANAQKISAIIVNVFTQDFADYYIFASDEEGRQHTRGLLWQSILQLKTQGISFFNLGGGVRPADSLFSFKKKMGGITTPFYVYQKIIDPITYQSLCHDLDTASVNFFPAYYQYARAT